MEKVPGLYSRLLRSTGIYAFGIFASRMTGMVLLPLYTRHLSLSDYGTLELIDVTMSVFSLVVGARAASAVAYFAAAARTEKDKARVYTTIFTGSALIGLAAIALGFALSPWLSSYILHSAEMQDTFQIAVVTLALSLPAESLFSRLKVQDLPSRFVALSLIKLVLAVFFNVVLILVFHLGLRAILWSGVVTGGIISAYAAWETYRRYGFGFDRALFRSVLGYSVPIGIVGISLFVFHVADRFFLQRYTTLDQIGLYSLGYKFGMLVSYAQKAFQQYWSAKSFDILTGEQGPSIFSRMFSYFAIAMSSLTLLAWVFATPAISLLVAPKFYACMVYVPWILTAYLIRALADNMRTLVYISRRPGLDAYIGTASATFCLTAYALLVPPFGAMGAAWSTLLTSVVMVVGAFTAGRSVFPLRLETRRLLALFGAMGAVLLLHRFLPAGSVMVQLASGAAAAALYALLFWFLVLESGERSKLTDRLLGRRPGLSAA
jgi:O-antigen/teichoic acid export membrane protein